MDRRHHVGRLFVRHGVVHRRTDMPAAKLGCLGQLGSDEFGIWLSESSSDNAIAKAQDLIDAGIPFGLSTIVVECSLSRERMSIREW